MRLAGGPAWGAALSFEREQERRSQDEGGGKARAVQPATRHRRVARLTPRHGWATIAPTKKRDIPGGRYGQTAIRGRLGRDRSGSQSRRPAQAQDAYPSRPITLINPFPPGGAADVVGRPFAAVARADHQAAGGNRDQGRRRGRAVGAQFAAAASPTATRCFCTSFRSRALPRWTRCSVASRSSPAPIYPDRALHRRADGARGQRPDAVQDAEGTGRHTTQEAPRRHHLQLVRPLRRAAPADPRCS